MTTCCRASLEAVSRQLLAVRSVHHHVGFELLGPRHNPALQVQRIGEAGLLDRGQRLGHAVLQTIEQFVVQLQLGGPVVLVDVGDLLEVALRVRGEQLRILGLAEPGDRRGLPRL